MSIDFVLEWIEHKVEMRDDESGDTAALAPMAELRPLLVAASVLGDAIEAAVLGHMLEVDPRQLAVPLAVARAKGFLVACDQSANPRHAFADAGVRRAAYRALAAGCRARLHRLAADGLERLERAPSMECAARIARHLEGAGAPIEACRWWRMAGELATSEATAAAAITYLQRALAPRQAVESGLPPHEELATLSLLGPLLAQAQGSGSSEVSQVYARSLEIAEGLDCVEASARFDVLWGLNACILVHGRVETARELGRKLLDTARATGNGTHVMLASRLEGMGRSLGGDPRGAIAAFDAVLGSYDAARDAPLRFRYASDQAATALAHKAWAEAITGAAEASERSSNAALEHARRLRHPHTNAHVACVLAARAMTLQERTKVAPLATAGLALARRHCFPYWEAWAEMMLGWAAAARQPNDGVTRLERGIAAYRATGATQALPMAYCMAAGLALARGHRQQAIECADTGLDLARAHGVVMHEAELLRVKALALGSGPTGLALLDRARVVARRQGAVLFERRATEPLAASLMRSLSPQVDSPLNRLFATQT